MRVRRILPALLTTAVTAAAMATPSAAAADDDAAKGGRKIVKIITHANAESLTVTDLDCAPPPPGSTLVEATGTSVLGVREGDTFVGRDVWNSCFYLHPDETTTSYGEATFTGEIKGCGIGTIELRLASSITAPDPVTGDRTLTGTAVFVPGSGTGGLRTVLGGFRETSIIEPDNTFTDGLGEGIAKC